MITSLKNVALVALALYVWERRRNEKRLIARLYELRAAEQRRLPVSQWGNPIYRSNWETIKREEAEAYRLASKRGGPHPLPNESPSARAATTARPPATPASTEASGRWTPTSGGLMEVFDTPMPPSWLPPHSKTSSPTEASSTEAGSPGSAPASWASTHDHHWNAMCGTSCPGYFLAQAQKEELT